MRNVITMLVVLLVVAVVGVLPLTKAMAGYDHNPQPKLAEDIIDSLMVVPKSITDRFGSDGERVRLIYNVALLRDVVVEQNKRIAENDKEIAVLKAMVEALANPENIIAIPACGELEDDPCSLKYIKCITHPEVSNEVVE